MSIIKGSMIVKSNIYASAVCLAEITLAGEPLGAAIFDFNKYLETEDTYAESGIAPPGGSKGLLYKESTYELLYKESTYELLYKE